MKYFSHIFHDCDKMLSEYFKKGRVSSDSQSIVVGEGMVDGRSVNWLATLHPLSGKRNINAQITLFSAFQQRE